MTIEEKITIDVLLRVQADQAKKIEEMQSVILQQASLICAIFVEKTKEIWLHSGAKINDNDLEKIIKEQWCNINQNVKNFNDYLKQF